MISEVIAPHTFGTDANSDHAHGCECGECACSNNDVEDPNGYGLLGGKWGESSVTGTFGGVVTWSVIDGGLSDLVNAIFDVGDGITNALDSFLSFDYEALLQKAFGFWSAISGIQFVQVEDDGGSFNYVYESGGGYYTSGTNSTDIRISGNEIDGSSGTLAYAFAPSTADFDLFGNITFDASETTFWTEKSFTIVAAHEIGHALGLDHSDVTGALMEAYYNSSLDENGPLSADDIAGAQLLYGTESNHDNNLYMKTSDPVLNVIEDFDGLIVNGTSGSDTINTAGGAQTILAGAGSDIITAGAGNDTINGGAGDDFINGGLTPLNNSGAGLDTAVFSGNFLDYGFSSGFITDVNGTYRVGYIQDMNTADGDDGIDTFVNINFLQFNDILVKLNTGTTASESINGTSGVDVVVGFEGNDKLKGLAGDDFISGGEGDDLIYGFNWGSAGDIGDIDTVIYDGLATDYYFSAYLYTNSARGGVSSWRLVIEDDASGGTDGVDEGRDELLDIDYVKFADGLIIDVNAMVFGTSSADTLTGDFRNNIIVGGAGADTSTSGAGFDSFYFNDLNDSTNTDTDLITDFIQGEDVIALIEFDINFTDLTITNDGTDTTVAINGTSFELDLNGVIALTQDDFIL